MQTCQTYIIPNLLTLKLLQVCLQPIYKEGKQSRACWTSLLKALVDTESLTDLALNTH